MGLDDYGPLHICQRRHGYHAIQRHIRGSESLLPESDVQHRKRGRQHARVRQGSGDLRLLRNRFRPRRQSGNVPRGACLRSVPCRTMKGLAMSAGNIIDMIVAYEQGELNEEQTIAVFQSLVDTGLAWQLQGSYGRTARNLIEAGLVVIDSG